MKKFLAVVLACLLAANVVSANGVRTFGGFRGGHRGGVTTFGGYGSFGNFRSFGAFRGGYGGFNSFGGYGYASPVVVSTPVIAIQAPIITTVAVPVTTVVSQPVVGVQAQYGTTGVVGVTPGCNYNLLGR